MSYQSVKAILAQGISRPTLFHVTMPDTYFDRQSNDQLSFLCKTASIPEVAVDTITVNGHESLGVIREQATLVTYAKPFSITVISDRDYTVYMALRKWFDDLAQNANPFVAGAGDTQRIEYYDKIKKQITLQKLEQSSKEKYFQHFQIDFNNAYPVRIGTLGLDQEAYDSRMEFEVAFTYETYTIDTEPKEDIEYE